ncbi:MAG: MaoC/PaaZ C-terminal domain-containing protein [Rhodospirillaceae bacterium]|nr:MaoC/PaaZ C-terminal domain-containing protein [Rhodospirillaceae bacterium]
MAIDYDTLMSREFPKVTHTYTERDSIFYALSIGLGFEPTDTRQIQYVYEDRLQVFPTMAAILAYPGLWTRDADTGLDWEHALHAEQGMEFLKPLPRAATIEAQTRVTGIVDKGEGRGALIYTERTGTDSATGEAYFKAQHTTFARRDGGYGGPSDPIRPPHTLPNRPADLVCDLPTVSQQGLLYRLNGDPNPHNADPEAAAAAGFERPILHGLCTYGIAGHAILRSCCDYDPNGIKRLDVRLSAPLYPGETVRTEIWRDDATVTFRCRAVERDVIVLNNGRADLANN